MGKMYSIGSWLEEHTQSIINQWISDDKTVDIFKNHKISLSKFSTKYAVGIISHAVNIMHGKKEMRDCPIMNKFVGLMLKKNIKSEEILTICITLRVIIFNNLLDKYPNFSNDTTSMKQVLKIFDTNLTGVLENFDTLRTKLNVNQQKELHLKNYLSRLQTILDTQDNIIFKLRSNHLYIANKALYLTTGVHNMEEYKNKFKAPLSFIKNVDFYNTLFQNGDYNKWITQIVEHHQGKCKAKVFDHITNKTSIIQMKITKVGEKNDFAFTLENITEQQNNIKNLTNIAYKDSLTGLDNLRGFEKLIENKLSQVKESNLKILMIELKGFNLYSEQNTQGESEQLIKNIADSIQTYHQEGVARIDSTRFAVLNNTLTLENSKELVGQVNNIVSSAPNSDTIDVNAAVILLHEKDTSDTIIERGEVLLNNLQDYTQEMIIDDNMVNKQEEKRLKEQVSFLSLMKRYKEDKKTLPVTNYYLEIPLTSSAKIIKITEQEMTLKIRKISAISLNYNDTIYIEMPQKPNFKAKVKSVDNNKNHVVLEYFNKVESSPLDRRNIHVQLEEKIGVLIKLGKTQIPEELDTVSITTFVLYVNHLYNIEIDSELKIYATLLNTEEEFLGHVAKIIPVADQFKLIVHLEPTSSIEKSLVPFASHRQLEIIKQLQEKSSY